MHELSITQNILDLALKHATEAKSITDLYLTIGQLSSVVDDSVQFYWDIIAKGTIAENAELHFKRIPTMILCLDCGTHYGLDGQDFSCPQCHGISIKIESGNEFFLEAIEVET